MTIKIKVLLFIIKEKRYNYINIVFIFPNEDI